MIARLLCTAGYFCLKGSAGTGWPHRSARWGFRTHVRYNNPGDISEILQRWTVRMRYSIGYYAQIESIRYGVIPHLTTHTREQPWSWAYHRNWSHLRYGSYQPSLEQWGQRSDMPTANYVLYAPCPPSLALRYERVDETGGRSLYGYQRYIERRFLAFYERNAGERLPFWGSLTSGGGAFQYHVLDPLDISGWSDYIGGTDVCEVNLHHRDGLTFINDVLSYEYAGYWTSSRNFSIPYGAM